VATQEKKGTGRIDFKNMNVLKAKKGVRISGEKGVFFLKRCHQRDTYHDQQKGRGAGPKTPLPRCPFHGRKGKGKGKEKARFGKEGKSFYARLWGRGLHITQFWKEKKETPLYADEKTPLGGKVPITYRSKGIQLFLLLWKEKGKKKKKEKGSSFRELFPHNQ